MKKVYLISIIIFFVGCVTTNQAVYRDSNDFNILDMGSYEVSVNKNFVYIGFISNKFHGSNLDDDMGSTVKYDKHVFVDETEGKENVKKAIIILDGKLTDPHHYFRTDASFDNYKGRYFDKGYKKVNNIQCAYLALPIRRISPKIFDPRPNGGYKISRTIRRGIKIKLAKVIGRQRIINIIYLEGGEKKYKADFKNTDQCFNNFVSKIRLIKK